MAGSLYLLSKVFTTHKNKFFIVHCVFLYLLCFLFQTRISLKYLIHAFTEFLYFDVPFKSWKLKDCKLKFVQVIRLFLNENIISVASKRPVKYRSVKIQFEKNRNFERATDYFSFNGIRKNNLVYFQIYRIIENLN